MTSFHTIGRSLAFARHGMCATSHPLGVLAALDVLRSGGNAVDAAVTAAAVLGVVEPQMTGIGGDCFAMISKPGEPVAGLNGSGRAAMAADRDWLAGSGLDDIGADSIHAVTVPGAVDAWDRLLRDHGTISLGQALGPAIDHATSGWVVTPRVAFDWAQDAGMLARDAGAARHYLVGGKTPAAGDVYFSRALGATLQMIADDGRDAFYRGTIADDIIATLRSRGGLLAKGDFAATAASAVTPVSCDYGGHEVLELPPNGQGATALLIFNILSRFDLSKFAPGDPGQLHLEIEAVRLAREYGARVIADPDATAVPVAEMLSAETADQLAGRIDLKRRRDEPDFDGPGNADTVYITVVDKNRMAVSFINSIFRHFGSGIATEQTGIMLHNRGSGFCADPDRPNCIAPGKRPFHTIIPAMVRRDGRTVMSFGVMGGSYQPAGHAHVLTNMLDHGMDPQAAIDDPRVFGAAGRVDAEWGVPDETCARLAAMGHRVERTDNPLGGGQIIRIDWENGVLAGGSDARKDGMALGI